MSIYVYALEDSVGTVRYVGRTRNPERRLRQHRKGASGATSRWAASGGLERMVLLEEVTGNSGAEAERGWIRRYSGPALLNHYGRARHPVVIAGRVHADVAKRAKIRAVERGEQLQDLLLRAILRELEEPREPGRGDAA